MHPARALTALLIELILSSPILFAQYTWQRASNGIGLTDPLDIEAHRNGLVVVSSYGGVFVSQPHDTATILRIGLSNGELRARPYVHMCISERRLTEYHAQYKAAYQIE